jgi:hypothetical protein
LAFTESTEDLISILLSHHGEKVELAAPDNWFR